VLDAGETARDVSEIAGDFGPEFFAAGGLPWLAAAIAARAALPAVAGRIPAPVAVPSKIVRIGLKYSDQAAETGAAVLERPAVFMKGPGHGDRPLRRGARAAGLAADRLGGRAGRSHRGRGPLPELAEGGTRRHGRHSPSATTYPSPLPARPVAAVGPGQYCETFNPLGLWLLTADEVRDPQRLRLRLAVNGRKRQDGTSGSMILGLPDHPYLRAGGAVRPEIDGLGRAEQGFVAAP
jgi:hypothetical protein